MNACGDIPNQKVYEAETNTTNISTTTTTGNGSPGSREYSSITTFQNIGSIQDGGGGSSSRCSGLINGNKNSKNNGNNASNKKSTKSLAASNAKSEDIPDHVLFIRFKHGEERVYSAYFRREQRHLLLVVVFMSAVHAVTSFVLDTIPDNSWNDDRLYRLITLLTLTFVLFIFYGIQRLADFNEKIKECIAIFAWFLLTCQMFYASTTTVPRHVTSDGLSWISLLTFVTQVTLPVGAWRSIIACILLVVSHSTVAALRNDGDENLIVQIVANSFVVLGSVIIGLSVSVFMDRLLRKSVLETKAVLSAKAKIEAAYQEKKSLLLSVLPSHVAEEMIQDVGELTDGQFRKIYMSRYENVSILFADIVGFTAISSSVTAAELVRILNQLFGRFDVLANRYHQDRIKILGDCYYCVCGALTPRPDHAVLCIHMGLAMVETISFVRQKTGKDVNMRVGVHTGACLGGVLGQRQWQFDVLGKEVTLANKMESGGIPARVHISEATKACLDDEFELEAGHGGDREEELRLKNVNTYLIKTVLKPYPQGTLDGEKQSPEDQSPAPTTESNTVTTTTNTTTPSTTIPLTSTTNISTDFISSKPATSTTSINSDATETTTTLISSTSAVFVATPTGTPTAISLGPSPSLHTTTTGIAATTSSKAKPKHQHQHQHQHHPHQQQQQQQQQQGEVENKQEQNECEIKSEKQVLSQERSQSVKAPGVSRNGIRQTRNNNITQNSINIKRNAKTRTTIAATSGRALIDRFYTGRTIKEGEEDGEEADEEALYDEEEDSGIQELRLRRGRLEGPSIVEMDLKRALEEKEANRTLGGQINRISLKFTDVSMETRYKHRSQSYSGLPLVALILAFLFVSGARLAVLPRTALMYTAFAFGLVVLTLMAVVSMSATYTKRFPAAFIRFAVTVEYHRLARILWGASACAVFFLCDVIPIAECDSAPQNISVVFSTSGLESNTQDSVCRYVVYYSYTTTLTLFAVTSLVNVGHVAKVLVMLFIMLIQCFLYLMVVDVALDNYDTVVYAGHTDYARTKHRLVLQAFAISLILAVYDRKMERLYRKLFLWKEESKREKARAMDLQRKNEALVFNLMPAHVAKDFISPRVQKRGLYSKSYEETGVIFAACPNFHAFYNESAVNNNGLECLRFLNEIISDYDELLNQPRFASVVKIKTVGPTYMAVSGMTDSGLKPYNVTDRWSHLNDLVQFAFGLQDVLKKINEQSFNNFILRIGINHGPLIAGVIGVTKPHYDVWGNTVNVASRMESTGQAGRIQVVEETKKILERFGYRFESRGLISVKGKGQLVTYFLERANEMTTGVMPNQVLDS